MIWKKVNPEYWDFLFLPRKNLIVKDNFNKINNCGISGIIRMKTPKIFVKERNCSFKTWTVTKDL